MTNAEARFSKSLRPRKPEGSLGWTAQHVHLDSHTAPELWHLRSTVFEEAWRPNNIATFQVWPFLKGSNAVSVERSQLKVWGNRKGDFFSELLSAESAKRRLQQLETSVNVANRGSFDDATSTRIGQWVAFIGCSLRMRRHWLHIMSQWYASNGLVAPKARITNYLNIITRYLHITSKCLLTLGSNDLLAPKAYNWNSCTQNCNYVPSSSHVLPAKANLSQRSKYIKDSK